MPSSRAPRRIMSSPDTGLSEPIPARQRLGATLLLLGMALLTALFWAGVIRLILKA